MRVSPLLLRVRTSAVPALLLTGGLLTGDPVRAQSIHAAGVAAPIEKVYYQVSYMRVAHGQDHEYLHGEQTAALPLKQQAVDAGTQLSWSVYAVFNSTDAQKDYKFVVVEAFRNLSDIDARLPPGAFERAHPGKTWEEVIMPLFRTRELVRREIWEVEVEAAPGESVRPAKNIVLDFMKTNRGQNALLLEREMWNPIHQARAKAGGIANHAVYKLLIPASTLRPYDYVTGSFFDDHAYLADPYPSSVIQSALRGRSVEELIRRTDAARSPVKQEYWVRWLGTH